MCGRQNKPDGRKERIRKRVSSTKCAKGRVNEEIKKKRTESIGALTCTHITGLPLTFYCNLITVM